MASYPHECFSEAPEGQWRTTVGRIIDAQSQLLQIANVSRVRLRIYRSSGRQDDNKPLRSYDLEPIDVLYDSPQLDLWWDAALAGSDGYNFRHTLKINDPSLAGSDQLQLAGGETYDLEYEVQTYEFGPIFAVHHARVLPIHSR